MKATIEVDNRKEAALIRSGLSDPTTRALVKVMGALKPLPSDRARARCLRFVMDRLDEHETLSRKSE